MSAADVIDRDLLRLLITTLACALILCTLAVASFNERRRR